MSSSRRRTYSVRSSSVQVSGGVQVDQRRVAVPGGQSQGGNQPTVRAAGPGADQQPDTGLRRCARQLTQRQGERARVIGLVEGVHRDRERLAPLLQRIDQAVDVTRRTGGFRDCGDDLVGRGGAGVDRDVDGTGSQVGDRVVGG